MKTRDVVRKIEREARRQGVAFLVARQGANHTVYKLDGLMIPIVRHREMDEALARKVFQECESKLGRGWWR